METTPNELPSGKVLIFRPWTTLPDGRVIYAKNYGKKVFPIWIDPDKPYTPKPKPTPPDNADGGNPGTVN